MKAHDPIKLSQKWLSEAEKSEVNDANAAALATVGSDGQPAVRMVLVKDITADGFTFFTHYNGRKAQEMDNNPKVALTFHWKSLLRQLRVEGVVEHVSDDISNAYFATRSRLSQLSAWASKQSDVMKHPDDLEKAMLEMQEKFPEGITVPRPDHWGGFIVKPQRIEFWQQQEYRLHDRTVYEKTKTTWQEFKLYP